jgi:hypothetical protein
MTLRLVGREPPDQKQRKWTRAAATLTHPQQEKVKAALRNLRVRFNGWKHLSRALGLPQNSAEHLVLRNHVITGDVLVRVCKVGGLSVDQMLNTAPIDAGRCPSCGAVKRAS